MANFGSEMSVCTTNFVVVNVEQFVSEMSLLGVSI